MDEGKPTSISRGIEIQKLKVEKLQQRALGQFKDICELDRELDGKIEAALSNPSIEANTAALERLFEKKSALTKLEQELEELILDGFQHQNDLTERWVALQERLDAITQDPL